MRNYYGAYVTPDGLLRFVVVTDDGVVGVPWWHKDKATTFDNDAVAAMTASMARYVAHGDPGRERENYNAVPA